MKVSVSDPIVRDFVEGEMRAQDGGAFELRKPHAKKVQRFPLVALGPHHEWSGDSHDKLTAIGFPVWAMRDKWSGKWLGLRTVPNNRLKLAIAYLYLQLVYDYGGMCSANTTDTVH